MDGTTTSLVIEGLSAAYDGFPVVRNFSATITRREAVGIVGANGAGKSTILKAVMSLGPRKTGSIFFNNEDVTAFPTHELVRRGITLIPEGRQIFSRLSVGDNLVLGGYSLGGRPERRDRLEEVFSIFPTLRDRRRQLGGSLSGGEQQLLAVARGLMSRPRFLLIDEPFLGLAPANFEIVRRAIVDIIRMGVGAFITEENPEMLSGIATNICFLRYSGSDKT